MIRKPAPFVLLLGLASLLPGATLAQDAALTGAGGLGTGFDASTGVALPGSTLPGHAAHKGRHAARRTASSLADLTDGDMTGGDMTGRFGAAMPSLLASRAPAAPRKQRPSHPLAAAPAPAEFGDSALDASAAPPPIGIAAAAVANAPSNQPAMPSPEIASPGPANPAPLPSQFTPAPTLPQAQPQPQFQPQFQPMSPVLPRQAAPAAPHPVPPPSAGLPPARITGANRSFTLETGMGKVVQLGTAASSVFAADPKVAEVRPASANSLFIFGVAPGRTSVAALDQNGAAIAQYDVIVQPSSYGATAAKAAISQLVPNADVKVDTATGAIAVSGQVATPADADRVMNIVKGFTPASSQTVNNLTVNSGLQVNLRVRIAEMSRSLTRDLGFNWSALGSLGKYAAIGFASSNPLVAAATAGASSALGSTNPGENPNLQTGYHFPYATGRGSNINPVIDALMQDQLVHMLAEPNLTAMSGQTASFLVGGEFPIPVAQQNNTVTIEFKQFGVSLAFVPTVMTDGHISLKVRPEVSALSSQGAVQLSASNASIQIPALTVRRAETTVELGSGQSFAIAGLLQDGTTLTANSTPFLGDLPILGALFRSDNFQRNETELVIIVTPYIVRPVTETAALKLPTDGYRQPNDLERILLLRQKGRDGQGAVAAGGPARVPGNAGFVVQ